MFKADITEKIYQGVDNLFKTDNKDIKKRNVKIKTSKIYS